MLGVSNKTNQEQRLALAEKELLNLVKQIKENQPRMYTKNLLIRFGSFIIYPFYNLTRKTNKFHVDENCIGCGLCKTICPCNAIEINANKPVWVKEKCTFCLACFHRCPKAAIQFGKNTIGKPRYVHPILKS